MRSSARPRAAFLTLILCLSLAGCGRREDSVVISPETFVEYYTGLLRAQEKAQGDPADLARFLELEPFPEGWEAEMIAFAETRPLNAPEWAGLLAEAQARSEEPADR